MERMLEDQECHLLIKVIDWVLYELDYLMHPYVHNILVVIKPLLIDKDYYAPVEGHEIISNLPKVAGQSLRLRSWPAQRLGMPLMNSNSLGRYTHIRSVCEWCAVCVNLVQKQVMAGTPVR